MIKSNEQITQHIGFTAQIDELIDRELNEVYDKAHFQGAIDLLEDVFC